MKLLGYKVLMLLSYKVIGSKGNYNALPTIHGDSSATAPLNEITAILLLQKRDPCGVGISLSWRRGTG